MKQKSRSSLQSNAQGSMTALTLWCWHKSTQQRKRFSHTVHTQTHANCKSSLTMIAYNDAQHFRATCKKVSTYCKACIKPVFNHNHQSTRLRRRESNVILPTCNHACKSNVLIEEAALHHSSQQIHVPSFFKKQYLSASSFTGVSLRFLLILLSSQPQILSKPAEEGFPYSYLTHEEGSSKRNTT